MANIPIPDFPVLTLPIQKEEEGEGEGRGEKKEKVLREGDTRKAIGDHCGPLACGLGEQGLW